MQKETGKPAQAGKPVEKPDSEGNKLPAKADTELGLTLDRIEGRF